MKTIHFHVGMERCGSTLIQALFNEPSMHRIFAQFSLKYDPDIYLAMGPLAPVKKFTKSDWREVRDARFKPLGEDAFDSLFVTQENLTSIPLKGKSADTRKAGCQAVSYLTDGFRTRIVIIIRRQDTFIESLYNQFIKRQELRDFATFLAEFPLDNLDWNVTVDTYADAFGRDNVTVLPFERKVLNSAGVDDFIAATLSAIGITRKINIDNLPTINPSLAPRVIEIQRMANERLPEIEAHSLANWFEQNIPKHPDDPHSLMSDDERGRIVEYFKEPNRRFCETYLIPYDSAYYLGEAP